MKTFVGELKRRNVFRVGLTYLVVAWLVVQVVNNLIPLMGVPLWAGKLILLILVAGLPVALVLAWAYELTPEGIKRDTGQTNAPTGRSGFGRKWDFVIIAGLVLALGYFVWDRYGGGHPAQKAEVTGVTLAVLPFEDLSPNKDQGYFADGIAEELLNSLARVKDLRVTARTSSFYFKGKNEDMRTIGKTLGVENLLEGSVRKDGDHVRITTQLINAETGYHLWSETYDRKLTDVFVMQDEIAMSVANALQVTLGVGALATIPGMTRNADAYDEYLKGHELRVQYTPDSLPKAVDHFQRAVALDPGFAKAWIELAETYDNGAVLIPDRAAEWQRKFGEVVENAQKAAKDSPYVTLINAELRLRAGKWREGAALYKDFLAVAPKYGLQNYNWEGGGLFYLRAGHAHDAVDAFERAKSANPLDPRVANLLGEAYADGDEIGQSLAEYDRGLMLGGSKTVLRGGALLAALAAGDLDQIRERLAAVVESRAYGWELNAAMGAHIDDPAKAAAEIRRLAATDATRRDPLAYNLLASWAGYYGEPELALELQRKFVASGINPGIAVLSLWRPVFHNMRALAGFKDLIRDMGLVDYWRAFKWSDFCHPVGDDDFECS